MTTALKIPESAHEPDAKAELFFKYGFQRTLKLTDTAETLVWKFGSRSTKNQLPPIIPIIEGEHPEHTNVTIIRARAHTLTASPFFSMITET